jgi:nucleoside-diphosphate-sugar epimerase
MVVQIVFTQRKNRKLMQDILLIGSEGLVGKTFQKMFATNYNLHCVDKHNAVDDFKHIENFDAVVYLAQSEDYRNTILSDALYHVNVNMLQQTLMSVADKTNHFIYFSTGSVYQNSTEKLTTDSALNFANANPYVASKLMGELAVTAFKSKFEVIDVVRPFFIYGPGQNPSMLISSMIRRIKNQEEVTLSGPNGLFLNPIFSSDAAEFIQCLLSTKTQGYAVHNLAGTEYVSLNYIVHTIAEQLGQELKLTINGNQDASVIAEVDTTKFMPKVSLQAGIAQMLHEQE